MQLCDSLLYRSLRCPSYQLFQFALDIRIPHMLILQNAVGIDGEGRGDGSDAEESCDAAFKTAIELRATVIGPTCATSRRPLSSRRPANPKIDGSRF